MSAPGLGSDLMAGGPVVKRRGPLEVTVRPDDGGKLAGLRYAGVDLVLPPGRVPGFHGDTFWPSPQSLFDWPPPPTLDAAPYDVLVDEPTRITLRSAPDPVLGLQVTRSVEVHDDALTQVFTLARVAGPPIQVAPWQVTRAPRAGLVVWAAGEPFADGDRTVKQAEDPGCWFHHVATPGYPGLRTHGPLACIPAAVPVGRSKFFTDARGWAAHVHDGVLFVRLFPDLAPEQTAPRQGEFELFVAADLDYIELENQGAHVWLAAGDAATYPVLWRFARIDPGLPTDRLTPELVAALDAVLALPPPTATARTAPPPRS